MLISALVLGATAIGALGTIVCTGTKEKQKSALQKPTINNNHINISNSFNDDHRVDNSKTYNNCHNFNEKDKDSDKEVINAIRELFREQEQLSQNDQALLNDIMANNQELARLIRK